MSMEGFEIPEGFIEATQAQFLRASTAFEKDIKLVEYGWPVVREVVPTVTHPDLWPCPWGVANISPGEEWQCFLHPDVAERFPEEARA
jgi:hypothetical protein